MKVMIEMTDQNEIEAFCAFMAPEITSKPNISIYAQPKIEPDPAPQELPKDFMPAPEEVPFEEPKPAPAPEPAPQKVSFDEVQQKVVRLVNSGKRENLKGLLDKYGLSTLTDLKKDQEKMAQFNQELEAM
jgi:hypothetical protein